MVSGFTSLARDNIFVIWLVQRIQGFSILTNHHFVYYLVGSLLISVGWFNSPSETLLCNIVPGVIYKTAHFCVCNKWNYRQCSREILSLVVSVRQLSHVYLMGRNGRNLHTSGVQTDWWGAAHELTCGQCFYRTHQYFLCEHAPHGFCMSVHLSISRVGP